MQLGKITAVVNVALKNKGALKSATFGFELSLCLPDMGAGRRVLKRLCLVPSYVKRGP